MIRKIFAGVVLALFSAVVLAAGIVSMSGPRLFVDAPSETDPYPWYPALDLNTIPFHAGSGAWGAQLAIQAPTAPTITSSSNAANAAELQAAMAVAGRRVTITANIAGGVIDIAAGTDVEVVIPNGIVLDGVVFGTGPAASNTAWQRIRFTKASGDTIGGQLHKFRMIGASATDIVLDSLQISGDSEPAIYPGFTTALLRAAFVNNRIHSSTAGFGFGGRHVVFAGNSCKHNAVDGSGTLSSWGFRNGAGGTGDSAGPYVYYQNDIRGINYFQLRFHPSSERSGQYYVYVGDNTLLDRTGNAMIGAGDTATTYAADPIDGMWYAGNRMYVNGGVSQTGHRVDGSTSVTPYWRITGTTVHGATSGLSTWDAADGVISGTTYNAAPGSDPAWGAAGDPTTIDWSP